MAKRRGNEQGLVPIGELLPGFEVLKPALQEIAQTKAPTVQGRFHYSSFKQFEALHQIAEEQRPDMGFMTRQLTLCSLPRTNPGDRLQYIDP